MYLITIRRETIDLLAGSPTLGLYGEKHTLCIPLYISLLAMYCSLSVSLSLCLSLSLLVIMAGGHALQSHHDSHT